MSEKRGEHQRNLDIHFAGGVAWTAGAKWVTQIFTWASVFITARLLSTSDFGIAEMASYAYLLTNLLAEFGMSTAVLQLRGLEQRVLAQLHSFSCLVCALFYLGSLPAAPLLTRFFHDSRLTPVIIVINLAFFITGFQAVPFGLLQRDMDYRRLSIAEISQALLQAVTTATSAWFGLGYWSLVIGVLLGKTISVALVSFWKPVGFAIPRWKEIRVPIRLGWQTAVSRLAWACYTQSDGIAVGRVLGNSILGVYRMSMTLASAPADKISALIMRAAGPVFAKVQNDVSSVRRYFLILAELLTVIELPLMFGLGIIAPQMVQVILGPKWSGVVVPLRWLVLFMTLRTLGTLMDQVLISQLQAGFSMKMSLLNLLVMPIAFFVLAASTGTTGVAAAWVLFSPVTILPLVWKVSRTIQLKLSEFVFALLPAVVGTTLMTAAVYALRAWLTAKPWPTVVSLALQVGVGAIVYCAVQVGLFRERVLRYIRFVRGLRQEAALPDVSALESEPSKLT